MSMRARFFLGWGLLILTLLGMCGFVAFASIAPAAAAELDIEAMLAQAGNDLQEIPDPLAPGLDPAIYVAVSPRIPCSFREAGEYRAGRIYGWHITVYCAGKSKSFADYGAWRQAIADGYFVPLDVL